MGGRLEGQKVVVVGGTSGIGLRALYLAAEAGARGLGISRSEAKVEQARARAKAKGLADKLSFAVGDGEDLDSLRRVLTGYGPFDHLVVSVLSPHASAMGPYRKVKASGLKEGLHKFWACCTGLDASEGLLRADGSVTFVSGSDQRKAWPGIVAHAVVGGALNALVRTLAVELAPMRINVICPGPTVDGEYDAQDRPDRITSMEPWGKRFPLQRVGQSLEVAEGIFFLMSNGYVTGTLLDVDGGASV
ncbi:MAG: SDR family oxidoreductase [Caulobacteraceae bacterium]|nr:SDR family oxidoreductase [Caulobacteraceae bacterium]